jgi:hypothetical protein
MPKAKYEKSIRISPKPPKNVGIMPSYSDGQKQKKVPTPKSLTPGTKKKS